MRRSWWTALAVLTAFPATAQAQIVPLPSVPQTLGTVGRQLGEVLPDADLLPEAQRIARTLTRDRLERLREIVRRNPDTIALDRDGNPVRAREIVVVDPDAELIERARGQGFALIEQAQVEGLDVGFARFETPTGESLQRALKRMRALAGKREVSTDPLHFASGAALGEAPTPALVRAAPAPGALRIGIIDGGIDAGAFSNPIVQRGFAAGAPAVNGHAMAVASLAAGSPAIRGAAPGASLLVADVYGRDPAGGNATAIARAIGWMVEQRVPVVTISLVGPPNPLLARIVAAARARGTVIVAAVGNDGPAAPPAYPASYPQAVSVTGVDARGRALIEAGRARHLDYAAPGADMLAAAPGGRTVAVRGTSFAAPLVAGRLARAYPALDPAGIAAGLRALDRDALDLGKRGPDPLYGRGLVCGDCRTPKK
ncbi:MAG: S8 family serine peptidase [Sphingomonas sp.]|uniref:S8 family serine peptidase n=1 Tax=Sphingomonas sp. TaxID=28214 RepID=UPI002276DF40|nr:S8 family serine peptidase [Sphingomonas sp.]MCX8477754.1 S8 family serine peptidase [Sphingomonas sp.]